MGYNRREGRCYWDPERDLPTWFRDDSQVTPAGSDCENEGRTAPQEDSGGEEPQEYLERERQAYWDREPHEYFQGEPQDSLEREPQEGTERVEKGSEEQMTASEPSNSERIVEERSEEGMDLIRPLKRWREGSSSEDDIPLAELSKRLKMREDTQREIEEAWSSEDDVPLAELRRADRQRELDEIRAILKIIEG